MQDVDQQDEQPQPWPFPLPPVQPLQQQQLHQPLDPATEARTFRVPARIVMAHNVLNLLSTKQSPTALCDPIGEPKQLIQGMKLSGPETALLGAAADCIRLYLSGESDPLVLSHTAADRALEQLIQQQGKPHA